MKILYAFVLVLFVVGNFVVSAKAELVSYDEGNCPKCKPNEYRITVEDVVPRGDFVHVNNPPCRNSAESAGEIAKVLQKAVKENLQGEFRRIAAPVNDIIKRIDGEFSKYLRNLGGDIGKYLSPITNPRASCKAISAKLPNGAELTGYTLWIKNASHGRMEVCTDSQKNCSAGWCSIPGPPTVGRSGDGVTVASIIVKNWKHDQSRPVKVHFYFTSPEPPVGPRSP